MILAGQPAQLLARFGLLRAGKPAGYTLYNADGSVYQARTVVGVADIGRGDYKASYTWPGMFSGYVTWDTGEGAATVYATEDITVNDVSVQLAAIRAQTDTLGSATITVRTPVLQTGDIMIVQGDDYLAADGRSLQWSSDGWPNLAGATVEFKAAVRGSQDPPFTKACSVLPPNGSTQSIELDLTAADTGSFDCAAYNFSIIATLADNSIVSLVKAGMTVTK